MSSKYYITTALHYVNAEPHIGHAYETILGDVLCRYFRLFDYDVHFLTGVDEHGQKIVEAAAKSGSTPQQHCDLLADRFREVWERLSIKPDVFFRTTNPEHKKFVEGILTKLNIQGDIYSADYSGWYCTPDERFWTDKDIVAGNCPACGRPVEQLTEKNYFFRMSDHQKWLIDWINTHPDFIKPESRRNEVLGFLKQDLGDLCISRPKSRLAWGIPLPFDTDYVTYVWFDALLNYLSATRIHEKEGFTPDLWPADLHLIGKDIITTHAVYWPTMLHAAGFELPKTIFAHGWWLIDGGKMSKSVGNVIKPLDLVDKYGSDAFRYVLMSEMTPGQDATFSEEAFIKRYNSDLANDLGNLYSRLAKLAKNTSESGTPPKDSYDDHLLIGGIIEQTRGLKNEIRNEILNIRPNAAIEAAIRLVRSMNQSIDAIKPWVDPVSHKMAISEWLDSLLEVAKWLSPVMPLKMEELRTAILNGGDLKLFPRIDVKSKPTPPPAPPASGGGKDNPASSGETLSVGRSDEITIDDFAKVDLRVGKVIEARKLEGSDKLLVLQVQIGDDVRQIVTGIAKSYDPADLLNQSVVVVTNLKPAKLRGEWSHGMILAVSNGERHFLIVPEGAVESGNKIK